MVSGKLALLGFFVFLFLIFLSGEAEAGECWFDQVTLSSLGNCRSSCDYTIGETFDEWYKKRCVVKITNCGCASDPQGSTFVPTACTFSKTKYFDSFTFTQSNLLGDQSKCSVLDSKCYIDVLTPGHYYQYDICEQIDNPAEQEDCNEHNQDFMGAWGISCDSSGNCVDSSTSDLYEWLNGYSVRCSNWNVDSEGVGRCSGLKNTGSNPSYPGLISYSQNTELWKRETMNVIPSIDLVQNLEDPNKLDIKCKFKIESACIHDLANYPVMGRIYSSYRGYSNIIKNLHEEPIVIDSNVGFPGGSYTHEISYTTELDVDYPDFYCSFEVDSPVPYERYAKKSEAYGIDVNFYSGDVNYNLPYGQSLPEPIDFEGTRNLLLATPAFLGCVAKISSYSTYNYVSPGEYRFHIENSKGDSIIDNLDSSKGIGLSGYTIELGVLSDEQYSFLTEHLFSESYDGKGLRCVLTTSDEFISASESTHISFGNVKKNIVFGADDLNNDGDYDDEVEGAKEKKKTLFVSPLNPISNWREFLSLQSAFVWDDRYIIYNVKRHDYILNPAGSPVYLSVPLEKWADKLFYKTTSYGVEASHKNAYRFIPILAEGDSIYSIGDEVLWAEPLDNKGPVSLTEYITQTGIERVVCIDIGNNLCDKALNKIPPIEKVKVGGKWWKELFYDDSIIVVVDYNNYEAGIYASQLAGAADSFVYFVGEKNRGDWEEYLNGKLLIVVGDLEPTVLSELKQKNKILKYDSPPVFGPSYSVIYLDNTFNLDKTFQDVEELKGFLYGTFYEEKNGIIVVNPNDIKQEYCESLTVAGQTFNSMYCGNSLLAPYIASVLDARIEVVRTVSPAPGVLEMIAAKGGFYSFLSGLTIGAFDIDSYLNALLGLQEIDDKNFQIQEGITQQIRGFASPEEKIVLLAEQKAIPSYEEELVINDAPAIYKRYFFYGDLNDDKKYTYFSDPTGHSGDAFVARVGGRSVTDAAIDANLKIFNEGNSCFHDNLLCPIKTYSAEVA